MLQAILINVVYAFIAVLIAIGAMRAGFGMLDRMTKFDTSEELKKGNTAVGLTVLGMFVGLGVAVGMVIGMAVN